MKSKLFVLLLFLSLAAFSQVPDTETFTLQNVVDEVNPTTDDLTDCFNDAVESYFNASYKASYYSAYGNMNNLLMFRDYGPHNATGITKAGRTSLVFTSVSQSLTLPAANIGDVMILSIVIAPNASAAVTQPTGWTVIAEHETDATYPNLVLYYRVKQSGDASVTVASSGTFSKYAEITSFTNCAGVNVNTTFYTGSGTGVSPSKTGITSGSMMYSVVGLSSSGGSITETAGWSVNGYLEGSTLQYKSVYRIDTDGGTSPSLTFSMTSGAYTAHIFEITE